MQKKDIAIKIQEDITDLFEFIQELYHGSSSTIHLVKYKKNGKLYAMKKLYWNLCPPRIFHEFQIIRMCNHQNIIHGSRIFMKDNSNIFVILQYFENVPFSATINSFNRKNIYYYMKGLLSALSYLHSKKIIHFNVKPPNYLYNPNSFSGKLIGFQSSSFETTIEDNDLNHKSLNAGNPYIKVDITNPQNSPNRELFTTLSIGTNGYKAPEILMRTDHLTTAVDIWSAGIILLTILTKRYPFFSSNDDLDSLCQISNIIGTEKLEGAAAECFRQIVFPYEVKTTDIKLIVIAYNPRVYELKLPDSIYDLLSKMLEPCPSKRITAADALRHPFFINSMTLSPNAKGINQK